MKRDRPRDRHRGSEQDGLMGRVMVKIGVGLRIGV